MAQLKKQLGLLDVFCVAAGAMISSGLFVLPALAYAKTGPAVVFSYVLAGILVFPAMLAKAELATAMPKAGGVYFFIERSMGTPLGAVGGFASWFSLSFKSSFALVGLGIFASLIYPGITETQTKLVAVGCCLFFMVVNLIGAKHTGRFQVGLVLSLIGILLFYVIRGFLLVQPQRFAPFAPHGLGSVFATAGLIFVSFGGLTKICCVSEEIENPGRNIPLGMFLAFSVVMLLYAAVVFVTVGLLDPVDLTNSRTPISDGANVSMGALGGLVLALAALLAFVSTANAGILTASRDAMAMSRDCLLPGFLQRTGAKSKTPHYSIIFTAGFMIIVILFLSLEDLVKTASTLKLLLFLFVNLSLIVMRESKIQSYRPKFRSPLYPWLHILGLFGYGFLVIEMGKLPLMITGSFIACAFIWYLVYARKKVSRRAALVHVIERVTARELVDTTLPEELREIIRERDEITEDRFDQLIRDCHILDIDGQKSAEDVFREVSTILAERLRSDEYVLFEKFLHRETEGGTVVQPGFAIPHIVVEGEHEFDVLLVRARDGITFRGASDPVKVMFVLAGSRDERNYHLRALMAIAQIAQEKGFEQRWLAARDAEGIRNLLLLSTRKRDTRP
ncbi:MAG: amino acid permease [Phycisphaerales bacterium]|nr:MAG: amino acid permease [Phycisphaerales bacterium]